MKYRYFYLGVGLISMSLIPFDSCSKLPSHAPEVIGYASYVTLLIVAGALSCFLDNIINPPQE